MTPDFSVRRMRTRDLDRIDEIERASFGRDAYDRKLFAEFHHSCGELFLVVEKRRRICGYMVTCFRAATGRAEVVSIAVEPEARRKGAASLLMDSTLRRLKRRGALRVGLMVRVRNRAARTFYEKYGFERLRRVRSYYEDGADGILMVKRLE